MEIRELKLDQAGEELLDAWYRLNRTWKLEHIRDEPVFSRDELIDQVRGSLVAYDLRIIYTGHGTDTMTGLASIWTPKDRSGTMPGSVRLYVHPDHRRMGIGRKLLCQAVARISETGVSTVRFFTSSCVPAGSVFAEKLGLRRVSDSASNRLTLAETDEDLLKSWMLYPSGGEPEVAMALWADSTPDDRYAELAEFYQTVHDAEKGEPDFVEHTFTEKDLRKREAAAEGSDSQNLTLVCCESETGRLLGMTDVSWFPSRPQVLYQGYTAVLPDVRGRGIGKRLKAEMLYLIRDRIPEAMFIRSQNADYREPILRINDQLGFRCTNTITIWETDVVSLQERLSEGCELLR